MVILFAVYSYAGVMLLDLIAKSSEQEWSVALVCEGFDPLCADKPLKTEKWQSVRIFRNMPGNSPAWMR